MSTDVTLKDIAKALEVSVMTVSRALNDKPNVDENTRKEILNMAERLGYTPNHIAKSLVSNKTNTLGVVIPEITQAFFPEVVRGIEDVTNKSDYQLFLTNANESFEREKMVINALRSKRVDGILISSSQRDENYSFYKNLIQSDIKVVFFDRCIKNIGASCISVDDFESTKKITEHLIKIHGYEKIAYLSGPPDVSIGKERLEGYLEALRENGLSRNDQWMIEAGFQEEAGYKAMNKLLGLSKVDLPEAVVCVNDPVAFGAYKVMREANISIPEEIAIVGFTDDIRASMLEIPLTTIRQPAYEVGEKAAKKLISEIESPDCEAENIEAPTTLKIRKSCGCT